MPEEKKEKGAEETSQEMIAENCPKLRHQIIDPRSSENTKQDKYP